MPRCTGETMAGYGFAFASVALAVALRFALDPFLGSAFPYETLHLAILLTAWRGGFWPALAAVALGAFAANYFFVLPRWSLQLESPDQQVGLGLFVFIGTGMAMLAGSMHAERRRAEAAASALEAQRTLIDEAHDTVKTERDWFQRIVSTVPVVICSFRQRPDGTTCFPFASPAIESIYGVDPQDLAEDASPIFSRMHPEDAGRVRATIETSARDLSAWRCEFRVRNPNGRELWVEGHSIPSLEADGGILWQGYVADITERKRFEAVLRESDTRYRTLFDYAPDGIVIADAQSRYLDGNASICRMLGYSREEFIGLHASDIIVPTEHAYIEQALISIRSMANHQRTWHFRRKDGSIFEAEVMATMTPAAT